MINFSNTKPNITEQELNEFEQDFGINLPESYKNHILTYNGGKPEYSFFKELHIHYFHNIKYGDNGSLESTLKRISDVLPDDFYPFAYDEGGNQIGFFLNGDRANKVYIWFHDMDEENELEYLADSFDEFMKSLTDKDDY